MEMMLGSKAHNNDANGLLRAMHSHNPTIFCMILMSGIKWINELYALPCIRTYRFNIIPRSW